MDIWGGGQPVKTRSSRHPWPLAFAGSWEQALSSNLSLMKSPSIHNTVLLNKSSTLIGHSSLARSGGKELRGGVEQRTRQLKTRRDSSWKISPKWMWEAQGTVGQRTIGGYEGYEVETLRIILFHGRLLCGKQESQYLVRMDCVETGTTSRLTLTCPAKGELPLQPPCQEYFLPYLCGSPGV